MALMTNRRRHPSGPRRPRLDPGGADGRVGWHRSFGNSEEFNGDSTQTALAEVTRSSGHLAKTRRR